MNKRSIIVFSIVSLLLISAYPNVLSTLKNTKSDSKDTLASIEYIESVPKNQNSTDIDKKISLNKGDFNTAFSIITNDKYEKEFVLINGGPIDSAWPMASHDNHHTGLSPYNTASNPGLEKWRYKTEGSVDCGIAIDVDGVLYFGDFHGDVTALYPDGSLKWKYNVGYLMETSTPCIGEDGTIYIGSYGSKLNAINPDGTNRWTVNVGGNVDSSPAIGEDGTIYVGHHNHDLVAVNPNGTIKWKFTTGFNVVSDPAVSDDGTIIFGSGDEWIYALYPNGTLRWEYKTGNDVKGSASIDDNDIIYIASWDGYLYSLYSNGTLKWKTDIEDGSETTPCFGPDGTIYVSYEKLWAINPSDGSVKWTYDYPGPNEESFLSNPAISADGIIYIGVDVDGRPLGAIYAINSDGTLRWRKYIANQGIYSSPSIAEDGTIYIGSWWGSPSGSYGCLHAFNDATSNDPPTKPQLDGDSTIELGHKYRLHIYAEDLDNQPIKFLIEWGDGYQEETNIWYTSGVWHDDAWHEYSSLGEKTIRAKSIGIFGEESDWAYLTIEVPYSYQYPGWQWLCERFPLFARILNLLK